MHKITVYEDHSVLRIILVMGLGVLFMRIAIKYGFSNFKSAAGMGPIIYGIGLIIVVIGCLYLGINSLLIRMGYKSWPILAELDDDGIMICKYNWSGKKLLWSEIDLIKYGPFSRYHQGAVRFFSNRNEKAQVYRHNLGFFRVRDFLILIQKFYTGPIILQIGFFKKKLIAGQWCKLR